MSEATDNREPTAGLPGGSELPASPQPNLTPVVPVATSNEPADRPPATNHVVDLLAISPRVIEAELATPETPPQYQLQPGEYYETPHRRPWLLPLVLFGVTCLSTFWAGATGEYPEGPMSLLGLPLDPLYVLGELFRGAPNGLVYMLAVMSILLAHEMGHFLQAVRYGIPASWPMFIPMPITPLGTMGAVIAMRGSRADRRQMFDIGITGPLAGLAVAIPVAWLGIQQAEVGPNSMYFGNPLLLKWMIAWLHPELGPHDSLAWNPLYMAGWVGMMITGLNMMPVSQLDGGHVSYALFGRAAHWLARGLVLAAAIAIWLSGQYTWILMLVLVVMLGTDHPRTANDRVPLGWGRVVLGLASLLIPLLCFVPVPVSQ